MIWVIACKFDPERPVIYDCVEAIRKYHPYDRIDIVDSASEDRFYLDLLGRGYGTIGHMVDNRHYALGAYSMALRFPGESYACIHDSLIINQNLDHLTEQPFTAVRHFDQPPNVWGADANGADIGIWGAHQASEHLGLAIPDQFTGIMGPMWFCQRRVMDDLDQLGMFDIKPTSKYEQQGTERLAGIALTHLGYDVTNSLQGKMAGFFDQYDTTYVDKRHLDRV